MKKRLLNILSGVLFLFILNITQFAIGQTIPPPYINYQAILYDVNGPNPNEPYALQSFPAFINLNDELGNLLYREEHYSSTDGNGQVTIKIGDGLYLAGPITNFNQINWASGKYYLVVEFDINGTISATAPEQLVTVPYAFYAGNSGSGISTISDNGNGTLTFIYNNGGTYTTPILSGLTGPQGATGPVGPAGQPGVNGQSAYDLWLAQGNTGAVDDFLNASAYDIWLAQGNTGTQQDFLNTLVGPAGPQGPAGANGQSAFDLWLAQGNTGTVNDFLNASAYDIWLAQGNTGTQQDFLNTLVGPAGPQGPAGANGAPGAQGPQGVPGTNGTNGLNALISTTTEPAGANCANGGTKIETGLDANGNGVLDAGEVNASQTKYVCDGVNGANGPQGPAVIPGASTGTQTVTINGSQTNDFMPSYLFDTGNCSNGNLTTTGNVTLTSTFNQFCNLRINTGHTLFLGPKNNAQTYTILADTVFISGTIDGRNNDNIGSTFNIISNLSSAGGSGGRGRIYNDYVPANGQGFVINYNDFNTGLNINPPTYSQNILGGNYNGNNSSVSILQTAKNIRPYLFGGNGTSGARTLCTSCYNCTNAGGEISVDCAGEGGDGLYIICNVFIFDGLIDLRGENAYSSTVIASPGHPILNSGSGAGGGGSLILSADKILTNTGTILTSGGTGSTGTCTSPGGNGGAGAFLIIER